MSEKPDKLSIDASSVTNREWLWLEDSCGVNVVVIKEHPMRLLYSLKTLAVRRWQAGQGEPPSATFSDVLDGLWDDVELEMTGEQDDADPPTVPVDAGA